MPSYGDVSNANLETCHPDLKRLFRRVVLFYDCSIVCGHRSNEEQARLFALGPEVTRAGPGESAHNCYPSRAADVYPYPYDPDDLARLYLFAGLVKGTAIEMGISVRGGSDWYGELARMGSAQRIRHTFDDLTHWELMERA